MPQANQFRISVLGLDLDRERYSGHNNANNTSVLVPQLGSKELHAKMYIGAYNIKPLFQDNAGNRFYSTGLAGDGGRKYFTKILYDLQFTYKDELTNLNLIHNKYNDNTKKIKLVKDNITKKTSHCIFFVITDEYIFECNRGFKATQPGVCLYPRSIKKENKINYISSKESTYTLIDKIDVSKSMYNLAKYDELKEKLGVPIYKFPMKSQLVGNCYIKSQFAALMGTIASIKIEEGFKIEDAFSMAKPIYKKLKGAIKAKIDKDFYEIFLKKFSDAYEKNLINDNILKIYFTKEIKHIFHALIRKPSEVNKQHTISEKINVKEIEKLAAIIKKHSLEEFYAKTFVEYIESREEYYLTKPKLLNHVEKYISKEMGFLISSALDKNHIYKLKLNTILQKEEGVESYKKIAENPYGLNVLKAVNASGYSLFQFSMYNSKLTEINLKLLKNNDAILLFTQPTQDKFVIKLDLFHSKNKNNKVFKAAKELLLEKCNKDLTKLIDENGNCLEKKVIKCLEKINSGEMDLHILENNNSSDALTVENKMIVEFDTVEIAESDATNNIINLNNNDEMGIMGNIIH